MELPIALAIAVLFSMGTSLILRPNLLRLVMGFGLYSNATNLLLIAVGGYTRDSAAPFVDGHPSPHALMDPLPPDIILTAIVISFAVGALLLTLCYRVYKDHGTDDPQALPSDDDYTPAGAPSVTAAGSADKARLGPRRVLGLNGPQAGAMGHEADR